MLRAVAESDQILESDTVTEHDSGATKIWYLINHEGVVGMGVP